MNVLVLAVLAAAPSWSVKVRPELAHARMQVEVTFSKWPGEHVCFDMPGSGPAVGALEQHVGEAWAKRPHDDDDDDCYAVTAGERVELRYQVDLAALEHAHRDADYALHFDEGWVFNEGAVMLRPDPLPADTGIALSFEGLEPEVRVASPWKVLDPTHFESSCAQYDAGSYVALGKLESLGELELGGATISLTRFAGPSKPDAKVLREWVSVAFSALEKFYGEVPAGPHHRVHVILAPIRGETDAGVFGEVMRRGTPSVLLLYGAEATSGFDSDWVAMHELFHLGNPPMSERVPWLVEGFTTYFADVLRARSGKMSPEKAWNSLAQNCLDNGQPRAGKSLAVDSREMRKLHSWVRVYQGGACLALRLDVAIRQRTEGKRTLDHVMRELRTSDEGFSEAQLIGRFDAEAGGLASRHLAAVKPMPFSSLLSSLGVAVGKTECRLNEKASLAAIRRAITAASQE